MKSTLLKSVFTLGVLAVSLTSCSSDDDATTPTPVNEVEVITTVKVVLTPKTIGSSPLTSANEITLQSRDTDGDGPNSPVVTVSGPLEANTTYTGAITFTNETVNPAEDITAEVKAEGDEHQVIFTKSSELKITTSYSDKDSNDNPIGLDFVLITANDSNGTFSVVLRHEPKKPNNGTLADAAGATDASVTFNIAVGNSTGF